WLALPAAARHFDATALTAEERARHAALRRPARREEFEVSRALLAHVASASHPPGSGLSTPGSPLLDRAQSLSHRGGHCALLRLDAQRPAGLDLEVHRPRDVLSIARNTFGRAEHALLASLDGRRRERTFYVLWTMKEALAKALGLELLEALHGCSF